MSQPKATFKPGGQYWAKGSLKKNSAKERLTVGAMGNRIRYRADIPM